MKFFQYFPKISYRTTEAPAGVWQEIERVVPNMTVRLELDIWADDNLAYEPYVIKDRDRPDTVAALMYGQAQYAWVIMLANKMRDWYDWPLGELEFFAYMNQKYESVAGANDGYDLSKTIVYQYQWITNGQTLIVDATAYATLPTDEKRTLTMYDHEYEENDRKRSIRLPTLESLPTILNQFNEAVKK